MAQPPPQRVALPHAPLICALADADARPALTGGKASNLARMMRLGLPVPAGFVVTDEAFAAFVRQASLVGPIEALVACADPRDPASLQRASAAIAALVRAAPLPEALRLALDEARQALGTAPLIARSSAVGEDGAEASFAGQLDSITDAHLDLEGSLRSCWASYWSARCLFYQSARKAPLRGMGVVVQEQIEARVSGVFFSRSPADPSQMLGEYCFGHGSALVSGALNPGRFVVDRSDLAWQKIAEPEQPGADADAPAPHVIESLSSVALSLERALGSPQDIEWTVDPRGRLFFVQTRPVTAASPTPPAPSAAPPTGAPRTGRGAVDKPRRRVVFSNANVNENYPGPVTPLLYSVARDAYRHYFRGLAQVLGVAPERIEAMEPALRHLIGAHGARIYYNLSNIHDFIALAPYGDRLSDYFNQFVGATPTPTRPRRGAEGEHLEPGPDQPSWAGRQESRAAGGPGPVPPSGGAARTTRSVRRVRVEQGVRRFEARVDAYAARTRPEALAGKGEGELLEDFRGFLQIRFHHWTDAALADTAAMVCYGLLKQRLRAAFPEEEQGALHNTLLKGLSGVVSSEPVGALWGLSRRVREDDELRALFERASSGRELLDELGRRGGFERFRAELALYLERYGFRRSGELMLTTPGLDEEPGPLLELVRSYAQLEGPSPDEAMGRQRRERELETARVLARLRGGGIVPRLDRSGPVELLLRWTQASIALRERARMKQALLYGRFRRVCLAVGAALVARGALAASEDIFFLTHGEIEELLAGSAMFPHHAAELVALRRRAHDELSRQAPPDVVTLPEGDYLPMAPVASAAPVAEGGLTGAGTCGGRVTARAAILRDLTEAPRLSAGDVLVTRQTDPGWGPVFFLIKGLVMERGGMLSHGAILAREFGLPAVVGVADATARIPHGCTVTVDGDRGHVRVA